MFDRWEALVKDFATHLVSRYGIDEVATWDFELWSKEILTDNFRVGSLLVSILDQYSHHRSIDSLRA